MVLTGQAKTDYQREYMRKRRSNMTESVRPKAPALVRPVTLKPVRPDEPEKQSYNPMMVGYVPPT